MKTKIYVLDGRSHRKIKCIGFLPENRMIPAWQAVKAELLELAPYGAKGKTRIFVKYFEDNYCNENDTESVYTISDWSWYRCHYRSQASIESSHFCWHQKAGTHPMVWEYMDWLQKTDALAQIRCEQIQEPGGLTNLKRPNERQKERTLDQLWDRLDAGILGRLDADSLTDEQFLSAVAVAVKMNFAGLDRFLARLNKNPIVLN